MVCKVCNKKIYYLRLALKRTSAYVPVISSSSFPVPSTTQSRGCSAIFTGMPVSTAINSSRPRSPKSIIRPWVNFEAGAGWIRKIPVIPLCHSGMEPDKLPLPLNLLQAAKVTEIKSLSLLFDVLAHALEANVPVGNFDNFILSAKRFEEDYTFWDECNDKFKQLNEFHSQIIPTLKQNRIAQMDLSDSDEQFIEKLMKFFTPNQILGLKQMGSSKFTSNGIFHDKGIFPMTKFLSIVSNPKFKY